MAMMSFNGSVFAAKKVDLTTRVIEGKDVFLAIWISEGQFHDAVFVYDEGHLGEIDCKVSIRGTVDNPGHIEQKYLSDEQIAFLADCARQLLANGNK